jgi:hypothetical protein
MKLGSLRIRRLCVSTCDEAHNRAVAQPHCVWPAKLGHEGGLKGALIVCDNFDLVAENRSE